MSDKYQGKPVTIVRAATSTDAGYNSGVDQVLVKFADGIQKLVPRAEVINPDQEQPADQAPEARKAAQK